MGPITAVYTWFRTVTLAGKRWRVSEATVSDLTRLQAWIDTKQEDPFPLLDDLCTIEDEAGKRRAAAALWDNFDRELPSPLNEEGQVLLATAEGVCQLLATALARHHPSLSPEKIVDIASRMNESEFSALTRVFWGSQVKPILARILGCDEGGSGREIDWPEAVMSVAERYGWSLSQISELTLTQFGMALRGGSPVVYKMRALPGESMAEQVARIRRERGLNGDGFAGV